MINERKSVVDQKEIREIIILLLKQWGLLTQVVINVQDNIASNIFPK